VNTQQFLTLFAVLAVVWLVCVGLIALCNKKIAEAALKRLNENPEDVEQVTLMDQDGVQLSVRFNDKSDVKLAVRGVEAVRLFDKLGKTAPHAIRILTRGGEPVQGEA